MEEQPIGEIKSNFRKKFFMYYLVLTIPLLLIGGSGYYIYEELDLESAIDAVNTGLVELGSPPISIDPRFFFVVIAVIILAPIAMITKFVDIYSVRYIFYRDRVVRYGSIMFLQVAGQEVPYSHIHNVTVEESGLKGSGDIDLELSGEKKPHLVMISIDNVAGVVAHIQQIIRNYRASFYAQYAMDSNVDQILDRL